MYIDLVGGCQTKPLGSSAQPRSELSPQVWSDEDERFVARATHAPRQQFPSDSDDVALDDSPRGFAIEKNKSKTELEGKRCRRE